MATLTKHNNLKIVGLNESADIREVVKNFEVIDDGLCKFYVATLKSTNIYSVETGTNKTTLADGYGLTIAIPSNSTGAVKINVDSFTAPLVKSDGNPVTNLKQNGIYTLRYYKGNFILASGGADDVNFSTSDLLEGKTANNSDGEKVNGTMKNVGQQTATINAGGKVTISKGYHNGTGYIQANSMSTQLNSLGVTLTGANQLVNGVKAVDKNGNVITGTATIESLGGYKYVSGTVNIPLYYSKRGPSDSYIWSNETITLKEALNNKYKNIICYSISYTGCEDYNAGQSSRKMRGISAYGIIFKDMRKGMMCPKASMSLTQYNEINFDTEMREIFDDFTIMRIGNECPIAKYWNNPADGATVTYGTMKYGIICHDA